jgi:hypothetical protein
VRSLDTDEEPGFRIEAPHERGGGKTGVGRAWRLLKPPQAVHASVVVRLDYLDVGRLSFDTFKWIWGTAL